MRTEQLWKCLAAICVHTALTMYRWCVLTDRLRLVCVRACVCECSFGGVVGGAKDGFGYFSEIYSHSHM